MPTFASLFTGGGLADVGAMAAGYELLWGVEYDPAIAAVANANLPHTDQVYAESVVGFDWAKVARPDHLHMSPPCQDFSVAKKTGIVSNDNDALAEACLSAIRTLEPATVTLENVEGYRKAPGFQAIVDTLYGLGYWVDWQVLNSADFGVPQTRRRLFLRAAREMFLPPLPTPTPWVGWYQAIEDLIPTLPETKFAPWQLARLPESLTHLCHGTERISPDYVEPARRLASDPCWTLKSSDYKGIPKALLVHRNDQRSMPTREGDDPAFTILAGGNATHAPSVLHRAAVSGRVVRMTPRALARFQSVPDWYVLPEKSTLACKVIGNGVPCLMMQRVMESFNETH